VTGLLLAFAGLWGLWASAFDHAAISSVFTWLAIALFLLALLFLWDPEYLGTSS
jgi:hypothetical protein